MKRWLRGMVVLGLVAGPVATAESCASPTGTGSETHFVCANDEECIRAGKGDRCVEHRCVVLESDASFRPDTSPNPRGAGGAAAGSTGGAAAGGTGGVAAGGTGNRGGRGGTGALDSGSGGIDGGPDSNVPEGGGGPVGDPGTDASCGDTQHDNANCGQCGHACTGASNCIDGECHCPNCGGPGYIAVDATRVYFTLRYDPRTGIVAEQPLAGGTPTTRGTWQYGVAMTVTPTSVFYVNDVGLDGTMYELAKAGGPATPVRSHIPVPISIANDGTNAYWLDGVGTAPGFALKKVPLSGGPEVTLSAGLYYPLAVTVDANGVYVANIAEDAADGGFGNGEILKVPLSGGTPIVLATAPATTGITVDATNVYWTSPDKILKAPIGGGAVTVLASDQANPAQVVVDATHVYWTTTGQAENDGTIMKAPLAGGTPTVLASQQYNPWAIAVDSGYVYWVDPFTGTAKRVAK